MNRLKKGLLLSLGLAGVLTLAAFSTPPAFLTTVVVRVLGPWYTSPMPFDSSAINQVGGHVQFYLAGDSCWIGQIVFISAKNTVKPGTTLANYNTVAGVVVGGTRTSMQASVAVADTFTLAATANQRVIVMDVGRFWVLDSGGGKSPGTLVRPTAASAIHSGGRMASATTAIDTNYRVIGRLVDTSVSGKAALVQIHVK